VVTLDTGVGFSGRGGLIYSHNATLQVRDVVLRTGFAGYGGALTAASCG
jgi:hypothetical protein